MEITPTIVVLGATVSILVSALKWLFSIREKWQCRLLALGLGILFAGIFMQGLFPIVILNGLTIGIWAAGMYNMAVKPAKQEIKGWTEIQ